MSHSPPNYMDGVPVKISERFKPPPKITLPQSVVNRLAQVNAAGEGVLRVAASYDFELETTVLKRIGEWRAAKEKERYEREERVRLKEQERARLAEEEQKRKLNQISYPNTDDLSSASEEGSEDENESSPSGSSEERLGETVSGCPGAVQQSHLSQFDTILMPTVLPDIALVSRDPVKESSTLLNFTIPKNTNLLNNNNSIYNKINYSDFENDTSSPFDNMELKTINDLDILAQVYKLDISNSAPEQSLEDSNENKTETVDKSANHSDIQNPEVTPTQSTKPADQPALEYQPQYPLTYSTQSIPANEYYKSYNSYHYNNYGQFATPTTSNASNYASPAATDSRFLSQYQSIAGTSYPQQQQQPVQSQYQPFSLVGSPSYNYYPYSTTSSDSSSATQSTYANAYFYGSTYAGHHSRPAGYNFAVPMHTNTPNASVADTASTGGTTVVGRESITASMFSAESERSSIKSKSKSVPDIVRQLDEEVKDSAQRRTRNNSQSVAENHQSEDKNAAGKRESGQDFTLYNRLSPTDQNLVKQISSMGFPLERVAAVLERIGSDDKKIIEHLIPLSELLDLGFEEEKISEALVKFDNNKHKALDYLIS